MAEKIYVAKRDQLRVHDGSVHAGEAYPRGEVIPSLLHSGWVTEGLGTVPVDDGTHAAFAPGELAKHDDADPAAVKAFKQAKAEAKAAEAERQAAAEAAARPAAATATETAPAPKAKKAKPAKAKKAKK